MKKTLYRALVKGVPLVVAGSLAAAAAYSDNDYAMAVAGILAPFAATSDLLLKSYLQAREAENSRDQIRMRMQREAALEGRRQESRRDVSNTLNGRRAA